MKEIKLVINKTGTGMHARPASLFVQTAGKFPCDIKVIREDIEVNGKSIMGLMMLALGPGAEFSIIAEGDKEEEAIQTLETLVKSDFAPPDFKR